jgi:hypothetical protein
MATMTAVAASTSQVTLQAANSSRKGLVAINQSGSTMYISTVNSFSKANAPNVVGPGAKWVLPAPYTGILYAVWDTATGQVVVTEV